MTSRSTASDALEPERGRSRRKVMKNVGIAADISRLGKSLSGPNGQRRKGLCRETEKGDIV